MQDIRDYISQLQLTAKDLKTSNSQITFYIDKFNERISEIKDDVANIEKEKSSSYAKPMDDEPMARFSNLSLKKIDALREAIEQAKTTYANQFGVVKTSVTWEDHLWPLMLNEENINRQDSNGNTLLHHLIANGRWLLVQKALDLGANLLIKNIDDIMPLDCWTSKGSDHKQTRDVIENHLIKLKLIRTEDKGVLSELAAAAGYFPKPEEEQLPHPQNQRENSLVAWLNRLTVNEISPTIADEMISYLLNNDPDYQRTSEMVMQFKLIQPTITQIERQGLGLTKPFQQFFDKSNAYLISMQKFYAKQEQTEAIRMASNFAHFFLYLLNLSTKSGDIAYEFKELARLMYFWGKCLTMETAARLQGELAPLALLYQRNSWWNKSGLQQFALNLFENQKIAEPSVTDSLRKQRDIAVLELEQLSQRNLELEARLHDPKGEIQRGIAKREIEHDIEMAKVRAELRAANEAKAVLEVEKVELQAAKVELQAAKVELQAKNDKLKAEKQLAETAIDAQMGGIIDANQQQTENQLQKSRNDLEAAQKREKTQQIQIEKLTAALEDVKDDYIALKKAKDMLVATTQESAQKSTPPASTAGFFAYASDKSTNVPTLNTPTGEALVPQSTFLPAD